MPKGEWFPLILRRWHLLNNARMIAICPVCDETVLVGSAECMNCDEKLEMRPHGTTIYE